jgi:hypothetical protein
VADKPVATVPPGLVAVLMLAGFGAGLSLGSLFGLL